MRDVRLCLNCGVIGELTRHGQCSTCGSDAVDRPEKVPTSQSKTSSLYELEKIWSR